MHFRGAVLCSLLLVTSNARAASTVDSNEPTIDLQLFHPTPGAFNFLGTESGDVNQHLGVSAGLTLNYGRKPLTINVPGDDGEMIAAVVGNRMDAVFHAAIGLVDFLELGVAMPFVMQGSRDSSMLQQYGVNPGGRLSSATQGDLRVVPKIRFFSLDKRVFSSALLANVVVPSAMGSPYAGENSLLVEPTLALSLKAGLVRVGLNVGYRYRDRTRIEPEPGRILFTVDDELFSRLALAIDLQSGRGSPLELIAEVYGHTPTNNPFGMNATSEFARQRQAVRTSAEVDFGVRWTILNSFVLMAGGGTGLMPQGYGQPLVRGFLGLQYYTGKFVETRPKISDRDGDGIFDELDRCPDEPEDIDGDMDTDGCPDADLGSVVEPVEEDPDRDKDNIRNEDDQCPDEPEDEDGFNDLDGCPDPDNDDDGVFDEQDQCPLEPGLEENQGCPVEDRDNDGITDDVDQCPDVPGRAPTGCPKRVLVVKTEKKIEIKTQIRFKTNRAKIRGRISFQILDQVSAVLKSNPEIRVVIEGHTDSIGRNKKNQRLSNARAKAVRQALIKRGIDPERLESIGYGETRPIASNKTRKGRAANRRVEFMIVQ